MEKYKGRRKFLATTKGGHIYTEFEYRDDDMFLFGRETKETIIPEGFAFLAEKISIQED